MLRVTVTKGTQVLKYKPRLCKDCVHLKQGHGVCSKLMYINLVTGDEEEVNALEARGDINLCGPGAQHFQKK
jgi:hypothetical protein